MLKITNEYNDNPKHLKNLGVTKLVTMSKHNIKS